MKSYGPVKSVIVRSSPDIRFLVSTVEGWPGYRTGQRIMVVTEVITMALQSSHITF